MLTVTNPDVRQPREVAIGLGRQSIASVTGTVLAAPDVHAHNTLTEPTRVGPRAVTVKASGAGIVHTFPPASVTKLVVELT